MQNLARTASTTGIRDKKTRAVPRHFTDPWPRKSVMKEVPLIINVFEISQMKNSVEVLGRLKRAIEEVFNADGEKFEGARCEFNKKKFPIELLVFVAGKEFARVTLEGATAYFLKNGEKKALGNGHSFTQEETFTKLLAELAALKGVKVELHGLGMY